MANDSLLLHLCKFALYAYVFEYESMYANANASEFIIRDAMKRSNIRGRGGGGRNEFCGGKRLAKRDENRRYSPLEQL